MKSEQINKTIAISEATSFLGSFLLDELLNKTSYHIIGLSSHEVISDHPRLEWRVVDTFSLLELEIALKGVDSAIYLKGEKSMSASLEQGDTKDFDLLRADNFARASEFNHLEQVIYLNENELDDETQKTFKNKSFSLTLFKTTKKIKTIDLIIAIKESLLNKTYYNISSYIEQSGVSLIKKENHSYLAKQNKVKKLKNVRSIQRLHFPAGKNITWVAKEYMRWLPKFLYPVFIITINDDYIIFSIFHKNIKLLILKYSELRSSHDRQLFYIRGGLLAHKHPKGRLEFRVVLEGKNVLSSIHDFTPRLPWQVYRFTQAIVHSFVMWAFGKHLNKVGKK